jgi:SAM-dependent methyltransferase
VSAPVPTCPVCGGTEGETFLRLRWGTLWRCRTCAAGHLAGSPSVDPRFATEGYLERLRSHDADSERFFAEWVDRVCVAIGPPPAAVLDVGFGAGHFLRKMSARGYRVAGVEISSPARDALQVELPGATLKAGALDPADWGWRRFDLVTFWDCLQCMPDAGIRVETAVSLLRPEGILLLQVPNRGAANLRFTKALARLHPELARAHLHAPAAKVFFAPETLDWLARTHGLLPVDPWPSLGASAAGTGGGIPEPWRGWREAVSRRVDSAWAKRARKAGEPISLIRLFRSPGQPTERGIG